MSEEAIEKLKPLLVKSVGVKQIRLIADDASKNEDVYLALIALIQDTDQTRRMKASWALAKATELNPDFAAPHIELLMHLMDQEKTGGVVRELYKTLAFVHIPEVLEGVFIDKSFDMLRELESDLAVKYHAKLMLMKYVKKYPELKHEIILSLQSVMEVHSDAWKVQVLKSIAKLDKMK
jgi:hypothetical protein